MTTTSNLVKKQILLGQRLKVLFHTVMDTIWHHIVVQSIIVMTCLISIGSSMTSPLSQNDKGICSLVECLCCDVMTCSTEVILPFNKCLCRFLSAVVTCIAILSFQRSSLGCFIMISCWIALLVDCLWILTHQFSITPLSRF